MILACPSLKNRSSLKNKLVLQKYYRSTADYLETDYTNSWRCSWAAAAIGSPSFGPATLWVLHVRSPRLPPHKPSRLQPPSPLSEPVEPWRGGAGHQVKVFSSLDLEACWERLGERMAALEQGLGVKILILLKNSWFEFLFTSLSPPSPHKSREMKNLFRGEPVK